jgi:hypothetical protein
MEGWRALTERLGVAGAMRFMMQYDPGFGDYTRERQGLFGDLTMEDALRQVREIEALRAKTNPGDSPPAPATRP